MYCHCHNVEPGLQRGSSSSSSSGIVNQAAAGRRLTKDKHKHENNKDEDIFKRTSVLVKETIDEKSVSSNRVSHGQS